MAPSRHARALQSFNDWMNQRRPWHYALIMACAVAAASTVATIITQQLLHGHLDPGAVVGTATGTLIGAFTVGLGVRLTRPPKH